MNEVFIKMCVTILNRFEKVRYYELVSLCTDFLIIVGPNELASLFNDLEAF